MNKRGRVLCFVWSLLALPPNHATAQDVAHAFLPEIPQR